MLVLFCSDPLRRRQPDEAYAAEAAAAEAHNLPYALVSYEALVDESDPERAIRMAPEQTEPTLGVYRGWMLQPEQYAQLYAALARRNIHLISDPAAYIHTHYLPESYGVIAGQTPRTVWLRLPPDGAPLDMDAVMALLSTFGDRPLILKDYVKSRKHEWDEACYIPSAVDRVAVERIVRRFLELQGPDLNEGLVFREYVAFMPLGTHTASGMPLSREYRSFWLDGKPLVVAPYWEQGDYEDDGPPIVDFRQVAHAVRSRFFTMDMAQRRDDKAWQIVELGDGQVAGLPERLDVTTFYGTLAARLP